MSNNKCLKFSKSSSYILGDYLEFCCFLILSQKVKCTSPYNTQSNLRDTTGSVPDHRRKASHMNFLVSQCIYKLFALYCNLLTVQLFGLKKQDMP